MGSVVADARLVDAAENRRARLAALYDAHGARTYRLALRYGRGDRAFAEDLVQEVFLELIERLDEGHEIHTVPGWLYRATVHRALNRLRRERFLQLPAVRWLLGMQTPRPRGPERIELERAELRTVLSWIEDLPDRERVIVCMRHLDGTPQVDIADILGLSPGYVSKILTRAEAKLEALRSAAEQEGRR
jgi:RNA polymerase sigma-70 factor, ECF subfamily